MKKYILLLFVLFIFDIQTTSAACTQEEINTFKRIEDDYKVKYEYDKSIEKYNLYLERSKPNMYDYIIYTNNQLVCTDINETETKCSSFVPGEYELAIAGQTESCNDILKTITLKLPKYNKLADDPLCDGYEDFVLCNPAYDKEIEYDTFLSRLETYKKKHTPTEKEEKPQEEPNEKNEIIVKMTNYLKQYWIEIIIVVVFIILLVITTIITAKSIRKSRYLE